ncbi:hypothetical protein CCACVL1_01109, partial [Corchorus capsularis]
SGKKGQLLLAQLLHIVKGSIHLAHPCASKHFSKLPLPQLLFQHKMNIICKASKMMLIQ